MIKYTGNLSQRCQCCDDYKIKAPFYECYSDIRGKLIGIICRKCAVRELFGSKYKQNPRYHRWLEKENDLRKM